jgi:hypothetical protein
VNKKYINDEPGIKSEQIDKALGGVRIAFGGGCMLTIYEGITSSFSLVDISCRGTYLI